MCSIVRVFLFTRGRKQQLIPQEKQKVDADNNHVGIGFTLFRL